MLDFSDLTPHEEKVNIAGKVYTLKEASGAAGTRYRNKLAEAFRLTDGKVSGISGAADAESLLVSLCLFDENNKQVSISTVTSWPDRVQKQLAKRIKEVSELEELDTAENLEKQLTELQAKLEKARNKEGSVKNSSDDTTAG